MYIHSFQTLTNVSSISLIKPGHLTSESVKIYMRTPANRACCQHGFANQMLYRHRLLKVVKDKKVV